MKILRPALLMACLGAGTPALTAVIGTNAPPTPLTLERVAALPEWKVYWERSQRQRRADQDFFQAELQAHQLKQATYPPLAYLAKGEVLDKTPEWYRDKEARHIADGIVSFQTPAGGWCMNTDFTKEPRVPGEMFAAYKWLHSASTNSAGPNDAETDEPGWNHVGTLDNNATTTELRFLAKVITANPTNNIAWQKAFFRGVEYLFAAQFPNGGWPRVWPLQGNYCDAISFDSGAMLHALELMQDAADGQGDFAFVPEEIRARARTSLQRGIRCLLDSQMVVNGQRTVWGQQLDALTLAPTSARNYEMPALDSSESAMIVHFLMHVPHPDSNVVASVHAACAWFKQTEMDGWKVTYESAGTNGPASRKWVKAPGGGPIWARFYQIGTNKPIFGDRDRTIHDDVNELSAERRKNYAWFRDMPNLVLAYYLKWAADHPQPRAEGKKNNVE